MGFSNIETPNTIVDIYFLGSGQLAVPVLDAIVKDERFSLIGVATQPDRPAGRKQYMQPTAVGEYCAKNNLPVEKPKSVNSEPFLDLLQKKKPELIVTAAFGQILKKPLLDLPTFGCLNVHAALLPKHRGAAPINAAILEGDSKTGITFMRMDEGLDTGPIYEMFEIELHGRETAGDLEKDLATLAARQVGDCIWAICREGKAAVPQKDEYASYAPKLKKTNGKIDWRKPAVEIERQVRAMMPWPRAFFFVKTLKRTLRIQLVAAEVIELKDNLNSEQQTGLVLQADENAWITLCGVNALRLLRVIPEGRKEMDAAEFLRGSSLSKGTILE